MGAPARTAERSPAATLSVTLVDGATTTVHVAVYAADRTEPRVAVLRRPEPLARWCAGAAVQDAIVGGFFQRAPAVVPLGDVRTHGVRRRSVPFDSPWDRIRACVHVEAGRLALASRAEIGERPRGDLLQAGPMLVRDGRSLIRRGSDPEGFSAGAHQFDSDITNGRYPRAALGCDRGLIWTVACDGRGPRDAGMTLEELAELMLDLGVRDAINLDGGGSASLVCDGQLVNRPRAEHGIDLGEGRPICTALALLPR